MKRTCSWFVGSLLLLQAAVLPGLAAAKRLFTVHPSTRTVTCLATTGRTLMIGTTGGLVALGPQGGETLLQGTPIRMIRRADDTACAAYVAADTGLYRYEGNRLTRLYDEAVTSFLPYRRGLLLGGLSGRILHWNGTSVDDFVSLVSQSPVHSLVDSDGQLRAATVQGLWAIDEGQADEEEVDPSPLTRTITVLRSMNNRLYAGTPAGLYVLDEGTWVGLGQGEAATIHVTALSEDPTGVLYVATAGDGLYQLRQGSLEPLGSGPEFATAVVYHGGELYTGTVEEGTLCPFRNDAPLYPVCNEPPGNAITSLAYAGETETLIVGTFDNGVGLRSPQGWQQYRAQDGRLSSNWVSHVASGGRGILVRHSDGSVYVRYAGPDFRQLGHRDGWPKTWTCSVGTSGNRPWVGTYSAFYLNSAGRWSTEAPKPTLHGNLVLDVALLGREAWVATHKHGLYRWDSLTDSWKRYTLGTGVTDTWITAIETFGEEVWVGTFSGGLCRLRSTEKQRVSKPDEYLHQTRWEHLLPGQGVNCLLATDEEVWIGTQEGLMRSDGLRFESFDELHGLPSDTIWSLTTDGTTLWVGTDAGLCSASLDELRRY